MPDHERNRLLAEWTGSKKGWTRLTGYEKAYNRGTLICRENCTSASAAEEEKARAYDRFVAARDMDLALRHCLTPFPPGSDFERVRGSGGAGTPGAFADHARDAKAFWRRVEANMGANDWMIWRMIYFRGLGAGTYSFDLHLRTVPRNFMVHFLLRRWMGLSRLQLMVMPDGLKLSLVQEALAGFWFVGDSTDCDRVMAALAPDLQVPAKAARRNSLAQLRDFVSWTPLTADDLTPAQRDRLMREQALDQLLWETWHGAGFAAANVVPAAIPNALHAGFGHDFARPLFELVRLARRRGKPPPAKLSVLRASPNDPAVWRDYLSGCRAGAVTWLPADVVGTAETTSDAVLCALKAETLLYCGQFPQAAQFRRRAPRLAKTRVQALDLIHRLSPQDGQFRILVSEADAARDNRAWQAAAALYQQALVLYPGHAGYRLQYAHCLRESGENIAAEIQYRSARALGAPWSDVAPPLETLAAQQGEPAPGAPPGPNPEAESLLDEPPTADDVRRTLALAGVAPGDDGALLALLRMASSIRAVIGRVAAAGQADAIGRRFLEEMPA